MSAVSANAQRLEGLGLDGLGLDCRDSNAELEFDSQLDTSMKFGLTPEPEISEENEIEIEDHDDPTNELSLIARISALMFVSVRPLSSSQLSELLKADLEEIEHALIELQTKAEVETFGFSLVEVAGAWQFRTDPRTGKLIQKLIPPRAKKLSRAAAETLAIIAYKQPVQRAEIEAIRGVDALPTLKTLLEAKLVRIVGREASAGHPALYGTTQIFLEKFGLKDLSELPTIRELANISVDPGEVDPGETNLEQLEEGSSRLSREDGEPQTLETMPPKLPELD